EGRAIKKPLDLAPPGPPEPTSFKGSITAAPARDHKAPRSLGPQVGESKAEARSKISRPGSHDPNLTRAATGAATAAPQTRAPAHARRCAGAARDIARVLHRAHVLDARAAGVTEAALGGDRELADAVAQTVHVLLREHLATFGRRL